MLELRGFARNQHLRKRREDGRNFACVDLGSGVRLLSENMNVDPCVGGNKLGGGHGIWSVCRVHGWLLSWQPCGCKYTVHVGPLEPMECHEANLRIVSDDAALMSRNRCLMIQASMCHSHRIRGSHRDMPRYGRRFVPRVQAKDAITFAMNAHI